MNWESTAITTGLGLLVIGFTAAAVVTARLHWRPLDVLRLRPGVGLVLLGLCSIAALHLAELAIVFGAPWLAQRSATDAVLASPHQEWLWVGTTLGMAALCAGVALILRAAVRAKGHIEANVARRERALAESEAVERPFRDLVADSIQGMIVHSDETVRYANRAAAEMYGFASPEEMIGLPVDDLIAPEEHIRNRDFLAAPGRQHTPEHYVYKAMKKDGTRFWIENRVGTTVFEGSPAIHTTHVDVSKRVASEQALRRSEAWLQTILNTAADGIVTMDDEGRLIGMNPAAQRLFGYSLEEAVGQPVAELLIPEPYRERHREGLRRFLATGEGPALQDKLQVEALTRSGATIPVEIVINHMEHDHDVFFTAFVRDISDRRAAEERLRRSEQKFRGLIEDQAAGVMIHRGGKVLLANQALVDMLGFASADEIYALDDIIGLVSEPDRERQLEYRRRRKAGLPTPERYEARWRRTDGEEIWLELTPRIIDYEGEPAHQVVLTDITERKRAEEDLLRQTSHLELMQKVAVAANEARGPEDAIRTCIDEVCRFAHWPVGHAYLLAADGAERLDPADIWHMDDPRRFAAFRRVTQATSFEPGIGLPGRVLASGKPAWIVDVTRDENFPRARMMEDIGVRAGFGFPLLVGSQVAGVLEFFAAEGRNPDPKLLELMAHVGAQLGRVIERKRAEDVQATQQRLLKTVLDVLPVQICVKDAQRRFIMINRQLAEDTDAPEERWLGHTAEQLGIAPRNVQLLVREEDEAVLAEGEAIEVPQRRMRLRGREEEVFHVRKIPLHGPDGRVTGLVTMHENITERKRAEDELRTSQQLISTVIDAVPNPISLKDLEGRFRLVNEAMCRRHGRSREEILGRTVGDLLHMSREERSRLTTADARVLRSGEPVAMAEMEMANADGTLRWQQITKVPVRNGAGNVIGICGIAVDLTERKAVEDRLRASEARFRAVLDLLPVQVSVKDRERRYVMVNALQLRNIGMTEAEVEGRTLEELKRVPYDGAATVRAEDEHVLATGAMVETPERCYDLPGIGHRIFHVRKIPLHADGGDIEGVVSVAEDVTERKRAEERLRAGEQRYRALFEEQVAGVMIHRNGKALLVNQAQIKMFGYDSAEEIYALDDVMALVADSDRPFIESLRGAFDRGETTLERYEMKALRKDGSEFWIDTTRRLIDWEGSPAIQTLTVDITERKRAEEELRASQHLLSTVLDTLPNPIFLKNPDGRYRLVNRAMAEMHGMEPQELIGLGIKHLPWLRRAERRRLNAADRAVLERGERVDIPELAVKFEEGPDRWRHIIKVPLKNDRDEIVGILGLAEDITERKLAEDRLRSNEALLRTVLDVLPVHIAYKDAQLRYRVVNSKLAREMGVPAEDWIGKTVQEVGAHPPEDRRLIHQEDQRILRTGEPLEIPHREHRLPDGRVHHYHVRKVPLRDAQGLPIAVVSTYEDITERKEAEDQVRRSEAQFRDLAEGSVQGILILRDFKPLFANRAYAEIMGFDSVDEVLALDTTLPMVPPEQLEQVRDVVNRLLAGELDYVHEERRLLRRDGKAIWRDDFVRVVSWQGEPAIQLSTYDITPRKEAESRLKDSEARFRDLAEGSVQGMVVVRDHKALFANQAYADIMGFDSVDAVLAVDSTLEMVPPGEHAEHLERNSRLLAGELPYIHEERQRIRRDGTLIWRDDFVRVVNWQGEPALQISTYDITPRKEAEAQVRASEERYRDLVQGQLQGILISRRGKAVLANDRLVDMLGFQAADDIYGLEDTGLLFHPDDRPWMLANRSARAAGRDAPDRYEARALRRDGSVLWVEVFARPLIWEGEPAIQLILVDITERKEAQEALAASEARFRDLAEGSVQGILVYRDFKPLFANRAYSEMMGFESVDQVLALDSTLGMVLPADRPAVRQRIEKVLSGELDWVHEEHRMMRRDGTLLWRDDFLTMVSWEGEPAIQLSTYDITPRKEAEAELKASEERYRDLVEGQLQGVLISRQGKAVLANARFLAIIGYECPEELYAREDVLEVVHPDDRALVRSYRAARLAGEPAPERYEIRYVRKDGTVIWAENLVRPLLWEGEPASQIIAVDITERKQAEEALVASEARLREAQAIGHVGSWEADLATGEYHVTDETYRIYGLDPSREVIPFQDFMGLVHPEDRDELHGIIEQAIADRAEYRSEFRIVKPSGDIRYIRTNAGVVCDDSGRPVRRIGTSQDVTEQKLAELALSRAEQRYRDLVEGSLQGIAITDADRVITFANQALADIYGYDAPEDMLGRNADEMVAPHELDRLLGIREQRLAGRNAPTTYEYEGRRRDSTPVWIEVRVRTVFYVDHVAFQSTHVDITERKEAEERLRASEEKFRNLIEGSIQGIIIHRDFKPLYINEAGARMFGYDGAEDLLAIDSVHVLPAPEEVERLSGYHDARMRGEEVPARYTFKGVRRDGQTIWAEAINRVVDWEGEPAIQAVYLDITERKQAELELRSSQRLLRTVIDALPLMLSMKSCDGRISMVNATALRYLHADEPELLGQRTGDLEQVDAEYRAQSAELDQRVVDEGRTVEVPAIEITVLGRRELGRLMKIPVFGEDDRITGIVTMFEIVTERVEADRRRLESETRFRNLIEGSIQGVAIHDRESVMFANQAWAEIFGYETVDDVIFEMVMPEHVAPERREIMLDYLDYLVEGNEPRGILRDRFLRRDGTPIWLEGNTIVVEWDGEYAFQSTVVDVTDRVEAEERAESQRRQLIQADKMTSLGVLVSGVAHEINNPNNAISMDTPLLAQIWDDAAPILRAHGPAEGLSLGGLPYERALTAVPQMLERIAKGSDRIKRIVDRLKSFARKRDQRDMRAISLNDVVESSVSLLQSQIDKCTLCFSVQYESGLPPVRADFQEMEQVVINLIANACEALPDRNAAIRVLTWHDPADSCVGVDVVDEGTGISEEHLKFVMDPFFTTKRVRGGTGLGLSVSFSIVEDHDGDLQIQSTFGQGTTARLSLPVAEPE